MGFNVLSFFVRLSAARRIQRLGFFNPESRKLGPARVKKRTITRLDPDAKWEMYPPNASCNKELTQRQLELALREREPLRDRMTRQNSLTVQQQRIGHFSEREP